MEALWRLDVTFASVVAAGTDPGLTRIKLAWWRDALERLDHEKAPPEPRLQAAETLLIPRGITGAALSTMEEGWAELLADPVDLDAYAAARGGILFALSARLLGDTGFAVERAGELWALADLARHNSRSDEAAAVLQAARGRIEDRKWPRTLRPLGMLAALARRDVGRGTNKRERRGAPARMLRMIRHRLTGF